MKRLQALLMTLAAVFALLLPGQTAMAQVKAYFTYGTGATYDPFTAVYTAPGSGLLVGNHFNQGFAIPSPTADPLVLDWEAVNHVVTAENGDQIFMSGSGQVFLETDDGVNFTATWLGDFTVDGGTGEFLNATTLPNNPLKVIAVNDPFVLPATPGDIWTFDWVIFGKIKLRR